MRAEIIAIGDELVSGQRLDTNSQWISQRLGEIGIQVHWHSTVGDSLDDKMTVFETAARRADLILTTGGLGPTADDLTREVIAEVAKAPLEFHEQVHQRIEQMFASRGRKMPARNRIQAMFPKGSRVIHNPHGTAPGIDLSWDVGEDHAVRLLALPGVPAEIKDMWADSVEATLLATPGKPQRLIRHRCLKCFGVGESDLESRLPDVIRRGREPQVGITVSRATITLRITAIAENVEACQALISPTEELIREQLGHLVFGEEDDEIQDAVLRLLQQTQRTLAIVENATGGLAAQWMSEADPDHRFFGGGLIARHATKPTDADGSSADTDAEFAEVAPAMSQLSERKRSRQASSSFEFQQGDESEMAAIAGDAKDLFGTDFVIVIGVPLDADAAKSRSAPAVRFTLFDGERVIHAEHPVAGHPDIVRHRTAKQGLDLLRRRLLSIAEKTV